MCGGTGFIGGRLIEVLALRSKAKVRVLARSFARLSGVSRFDVEVVPGEVTDRDALAKAMVDCDVVVNCTYGAREAAKPVNIDAVKALVEEAAKARVGRVIHLSTLSVYGLPPDGELTEDSPEQAPKSHLYGWSKLQGEHVGFAKAKELDLDFRVLQPTVVYGPGAPSWTLNPLRMLKAGRVILVNGGDGICNAVYVDDLVLGILSACVASGGRGERFLISGPVPATFREFYGAYERMLGRESTASLPLDEVLRLWHEQLRRTGTKAQVVSLLRDPVVFRRLATLPFVSKAKNMASRPMIDAAKSLLLGGRKTSRGDVRAGPPRAPAAAAGRIRRHLPGAQDARLDRQGAAGAGLPRRSTTSRRGWSGPARGCGGPTCSTDGRSAGSCAARVTAGQLRAGVAGSADELSAGRIVSIGGVAGGSTGGSPAAGAGVSARRRIRMP